MTLRLGFTALENIPDTYRIRVEGSQAGPLISKAGRSAVGFYVLCNVKNLLFITVFDDKEYFFGQTFFSCPRFMRQNKYNIAVYDQENVIYQTHIFDESEKPCAKITLTIKYNPAIEYCGEKIGIFQSLSERQPVKIMKGNVESKNIFSFMDSSTKKAPFSMVEHSYRDDTWGKLQ